MTDGGGRMRGEIAPVPADAPLPLQRQQPLVHDADELHAAINPPPLRRRQLRHAPRLRHAALVEHLKQRQLARVRRHVGDLPAHARRVGHDG